jgi:hypothetical protein
MNPDDRTNKIIQLMRMDNSVDAPADAMKWVLDLAKSKAAASASPLRRLLAVLKADLAAGGLVPGERSAVGSASRQMLFEVDEDVAIDLRIDRLGDELVIRGQMIAETVADGFVKLIKDGRTIASVVTGAEGEFKFSGIPNGIYEIEITTADLEVVTPKIDIS